MIRYEFSKAKQRGSFSLTISLVEGVVIAGVIALLVLVALTMWRPEPLTTRCFEGHLYSVDKENVMHPKREPRYRGTGPVIKCVEPK